MLNSIYDDDPFVIFFLLQYFAVYSQFNGTSHYEMSTILLV